MITRNRIALQSALSRVGLKDFLSPEERELAAQLYEKMEANNIADKASKTTKKTRTIAKKLAGVPSEGIKRVAEPAPTESDETL